MLAHPTQSRDSAPITDLILIAPEVSPSVNSAGTPEQLLEKYGLTARHLVSAVEQALKKK